LVADCEQAVANPPAPTNSIGFVTDCDEMGANCRAVGIAAEECDEAVAICKSPEAGQTQPPAVIVTSCEDLRATCAQAGLTDAECDQVVDACENPIANTDSPAQISPDCASVLATCLAYGIAEEECRKVEQACDENETETGENDIRLK
jgi:hypothetical protein